MIVTQRKTISQILKFDQYSLIQNLIHISPNEHQRICSPFRQDSHPNCYFEWYNGRLRFVDWADNKNIDVIGITQLIHNCNLPTALEILYDLWYLQITTQSNYVSVTKTVNKTEFNIQYTTREWTELDKLYWSRYGITTSQLNADNIYSVASYTKIKNVAQTVHNSANNLSFAIQLNGIKIYNPLWKDEKWVTTCKTDDIGNQGFMDDFTDNRLVITKSYKDSRVIRNQGYNCIWNQNEGQLPSEQKIEELGRYYTNQYLLYDNDDAGKKASDKYIKHTQSITPHVNINPIFLNDKAKDASQTYVMFGKDNLMQQLDNLIQ